MSLIKSTIPINKRNQKKKKRERSIKVDHEESKRKKCNKEIL